MSNTARTWRTQWRRSFGQVLCGELSGFSSIPVVSFAVRTMGLNYFETASLFYHHKKRQFCMTSRKCGAGTRALGFSYNDPVATGAQVEAHCCAGKRFGGPVHGELH